MAKKVCPRLRDPASGRKGDFMQPRTNIFGYLHIHTFVIVVIKGIL